MSSSLNDVSGGVLETADGLYEVNMNRCLGRSVIPYIFALNPTLLILTVNWNLETLAAFILGLGGMVMTVLTISAAIEGWHGGPIGWWERILLLALGISNIVQEPLWLSLIILIVTVIVYTTLYLRRARLKS